MDNTKTGKGDATPAIGQITNIDMDVGEIIDDQPSTHKDPTNPDELAAALEAYVPGSKREKRLVFKVDLVMIPMLWFMCVLAYVDRNNIVRLFLTPFSRYTVFSHFINTFPLSRAMQMRQAWATTSTLQTTVRHPLSNLPHLHILIDALDYSMLISIFFVGYIIWEIPSNIILSRVRPSRYLPGIMVVRKVSSGVFIIDSSYLILMGILLRLGAPWWPSCLKYTIIKASFYAGSS